MATANTVATPRLPTVPIRGSRRRHDRIAICVPARNEEESLPRLISDLKGQRAQLDLRVIILDDNSTDATLATAKRAVGSDPRFKVLSGTGNPPPGWVGKQYACHRLAAHVDGMADEGWVADVLVFLDADVRLQPDAIERSVEYFGRTESELVSVWPAQCAFTASETVVQPLLAWSWMAFAPMWMTNQSTNPDHAVACGQFLVIDRNIYKSAGGHAAVKDSLTEDLDLARLLRGNGVGTSVVLASGQARCRMYDSARDLHAGYTRWLGTAFGGPVKSCTIAAVATLAYIAPPLLAVGGGGAVRRIGIVGYTAAVASRMIVWSAEHQRTPTIASSASAVAHPLSTVAFIGLLASSRFRQVRGSTSWKGRALPQVAQISQQELAAR
ncbi:glycosyltransferase [Hoyosella rhizosphaerae]|nr:glycosyltransferase [Hoyosella rhizosphaerae]